MKKEIDFSKAPEGATHYCEESDYYSFLWIKSLDEATYASPTGYTWIVWINPYNRGIKSIAESWTIHNNTKPLKDLTYEQAAELFNAWRSGGVVEISVPGTEFVKCNTPSWVLSCAYRIKPKSERELFVDAAEQLACNRGIAAQMFNSGKFKLVKDGER